MNHLSGSRTMTDAEAVRGEDRRTLTPVSQLLPEPDDTCDLCGAQMIGLHCKLRCINCGFMRDCSDP